MKKVLVCVATALLGVLAACANPTAPKSDASTGDAVVVSSDFCYSEEAGGCGTGDYCTDASCQNDGQGSLTPECQAARLEYQNYALQTAALPTSDDGTEDPELARLRTDYQQKCSG